MNSGIYSPDIHFERDVPLAIDILFRDSSLIICEKPAGILSESPGLPDLLREQTGADVWPVHRLDKSTGGVMILAFSPASCAAMQRLFQQEAVRKEYLAVVSGCPENKTGQWTDLLWHDRNKNKSYVVSRPRGGVKKAVCEWTVLDTADADDQTLSLVRVLLHTGRTHQIRVQFGSRGYPLAGDRKYGSRVPCDTVALWSAAVSFPHPGRKSGVVSVTSAPPALFPWNLFPSVSL